MSVGQIVFDLKSRNLYDSSWITDGGRNWSEKLFEVKFFSIESLNFYAKQEKW